MMLDSYSAFIHIVIVLLLIGGGKSHQTCRINYDENSSRIFFEMDWIQSLPATQGRPGKRGVPGLKGEVGLPGTVGPAGRQGDKGEKGESITSEQLSEIETRFRKIEQALRFIGRLSPDGRYVFRASVSLVTWQEGRSFCQMLGGRLASKSLRESTILQFVQDTIVNGAGADMWIGMHDRLHNDSFEWIDGVRSTAQNTKWAQNEPSDSGVGSCVQIANRRSNGWHGIDDTFCSIRKRALCELEG